MRAKEFSAETETVPQKILLYVENVVWNSYENLIMISICRRN